jgi:hypothetical protein
MSILGKFLYYGQDAHLSHVNPDFYRNNRKLIDDPYEINCVSCAIATDISLRGIQLIRASPCKIRRDLKVIQDIYEVYGREFKDILEPNDIFREAESRRIEILSEKMHQIETELINEGEKSSVIIYVEKYVQGKGSYIHVFNAWNKGEMIEFLDGQNNKVVKSFHPQVAAISILQTGFLNKEKHI